MKNIQDACQSLLEISNVIHYTSNGVANLSSLLCTSRIRYIRKHLHHYSLWFYHHICSFLSLKWQMCKTKVWIWSLVPCETLPIASMYIVQICLSIECVKDVSEHVLQVSYTFRLANIRCSLWTCRESLFLLSEAYLWYTESFILQHEFESFFFLNPYLCQSFHIFFEIKCKESTTSILCVYPTIHIVFILCIQGKCEFHTYRIEYLEIVIWHRRLNRVIGTGSHIDSIFHVFFLHKLHWDERVNDIFSFDLLQSIKLVGFGHYQSIALSWVRLLDFQRSTSKSVLTSTQTIVTK